VVSAALLCRYRAIGVKYWKPIQTGIEQDDDSAEVQRLSGCPRESVLNAGVRLPRPVSPHLAARLNGSTIDMTPLLSLAGTMSGGWIVEGAGGVLVPLNPRDLLIDLFVGLELPALIVSRSGLGTINHTLLTIEALRQRAVPVAGVVMVGPPDRENRLAIEHYGRVAVLGEMPALDPMTPDRLRDWAGRCLDSDGRLRDLLA
jgi:dethiobiotin synthetase